MSKLKHDSVKYSVSPIGDAVFRHAITGVEETFEYSFQLLDDISVRRNPYGKCINCLCPFNNKSTAFFCKDCKSSETSVMKRKMTTIYSTGYSSNAKNIESKEKTRLTNIKRYGTHPSKINRDKMKQTSLERYGVESYSQTDEFSERVKETNNEKYGGNSPANSKKVLDKMKQTSLERYGVESYSQTDESKKKAKQTSLKRYGVDHYNKSNEFKITIIKSTLKKYGFDDCGNYDEAKELFSKEVEENGLYKAMSDRGMSYIVAMKNFVSDDLKATSSLAENNVYIMVENTKWFNNLERNVTSIVPENNRLEIDILDRIETLSIEFNGFYWHQIKENKISTDLSKAESMRSIGYTHYAIDETDEFRMGKIVNSLNPNRKTIYARKCSVQSVSKDESKNFLDKFHFQDYVNAKFTYGLYFEGKLVQLMSFSKSRFSNETEYEMIRLCTSNQYKVVGGSQRLFKHFVKEVRPTSIVSYSDNKFFSGKIYNALGFEFVENTLPNYVWFKNGICLKRYKTMKHKLDKVLGEGFDVSLSETENMERNGWIKVKDLGNKKWIWKNEKKKND